MFRSYRTTCLFVAASLSLAMASSARADDELVVVELFTSQGCSSCPPADALISELSEMEGVLPLSLHVDYWDYIGWKDEFAQPSFTKRQRDYARAAGKRTVYTPQMIVQGRDHVVGLKPMRLVNAIERRRAIAQQVPVELVARVIGDIMTITVEPQGDLPPNMVVQLVRFDPHERVEIRRGENAGRVVDYTNIVTEWTPLAEWSGDAPLRIEAPISGPDEAAVVVQSRDAGAIVAAALAQ